MWRCIVCFGKSTNEREGQGLAGLGATQICIWKIMVLCSLQGSRIWLFAFTLFCVWPPLPGSPGLSWALLSSLDSPGLFWALLGAPGLSWPLLASLGVSWALLGSAELSCYRLGSPGLLGLSWPLLGSLALSWTLLAFAGLSWRLLGSPGLC